MIKYIFENKTYLKNMRSTTNINVIIIPGKNWKRRSLNVDNPTNYRKRVLKAYKICLPTISTVAYVSGATFPKIFEYDCDVNILVVDLMFVRLF
jgi:hypothetical protein